VKLVHDVKQEVGSRRKANHVAKSDQRFSEKRWWMNKQVWQCQRNEYF